MNDHFAPSVDVKDKIAKFVVARVVDFVFSAIGKALMTILALLGFTHTDHFQENVVPHTDSAADATVENLTVFFMETLFFNFLMVVLPVALAVVLCMWFFFRFVDPPGIPVIEIPQLRRFAFLLVIGFTLLSGLLFLLYVLFYLPPQNFVVAGRLFVLFGYVTLAFSIALISFVSMFVVVMPWHLQTALVPFPFSWLWRVAARVRGLVRRPGGVG